MVPVLNAQQERQLVIDDTYFQEYSNHFRGTYYGEYSTNMIFNYSCLMSVLMVCFVKASCDAF